MTDISPSDNNVRQFGQNGIIQPLLTDLYQITMAYAYWKSGKTEDHAVFDLFFRKNPFQGEFTIFAGLEECLKFLGKFRYSKSDIEYLKTILPPSTEEEFFHFLSTLTAKDVKLYAMAEGSVAFPRVPLMRIEGPLTIVQLLETTLLTLVNYASLMATNAARYRIAAGNLMLLEFGLRRAQGPDGGLSASKYSYIGNGEEAFFVRQDEQKRRDEFRNRIDVNGDGKADRRELLHYIAPQSPRHAEHEAEALLSLADIDHDNMLSLNEILTRPDLFIKSKMVDTARSFHDEF